jgi:hypothetical protein
MAYKIILKVGVAGSRLGFQVSTGSALSVTFAELIWKATAIATEVVE